MVPYGAGVTQGPRMLGGFLVKFALSQLSFIYNLSTSSDSSTPVQIPLPQCSFTYPSLVSSPLQATVQFPLLFEQQFRFLSAIPLQAKDLVLLKS